MLLLVLCSLSSHVDFLLTLCILCCPNTLVFKSDPARCIQPSVCLSVCPSVHPSVCPSVHLSVCQSVCLSFPLLLFRSFSVSLMNFLSFFILCHYLSLSLSLSVSLSVSLALSVLFLFSLCLSVCLPLPPITLSLLSKENSCKRDRSWLLYFVE